jgi:uncharacterized circularly permuted ATP-grasp superfamily protein/uncharacterized alpha-E superfamily protein
MTVSPDMNSYPPTAADPPGFGYRGSLGLFDETVSPEGELREHWRPFFDQLDAIGLAELRRRWDEAKHLIRENGVTYNVYGDPRGMVRPWELDPIPLLIGPDDFARVERGLTQRARLVDMMLADLYGPQALVAEGALPPDLVFGHPWFLRACHGIPVAGGRRLYLYAADIGRAQDGSYVVLRDRCQAPSGAGYALENRIVLSRMLPETFHDCRVHRLAPFFQTLRDTLRSIAPSGADNPRVVLLTPGPYNETYFEHAFLARYLGYTLVEGADLTVRDNRVYLKLLGGLQPVDVILRRLDDDYCDPLELRGDSFLGVPGLVQAVRSGTVAVANSLGSGLAESPALNAYLPGLCRRLLGEELLLESVPTWWCGEPVAREHVLANLHRMVIKPTFPSARGVSVFGETLSGEAARRLVEAIKERPGDFVGQELVRLSTAPVLAGDRPRPRHLVWRTFVAAAGNSSFAVMPGGLTRVAAAEGGLVVTMQAGAGSKDTWVLSDGPVSEFSLLRSSVRPVQLSRGGDDLPSRAADDLYWLGRYAERAEGAVRLLRGIFLRLTEKSGLMDVPELPALLRSLTYLSGTYPGFLGEGASTRLAAPAAELFSVMYDARRAGSLAATLDALFRVASRVRDRLSLDMWRILSTLTLPRPDGDAVTQDRDPLAPCSLTEGLDRLDRHVITLAAFGGLATEGMTRGQGWRFLDMGRRLERSVHTLGMLRSTLVFPSQGMPEGPLLEALLEIADSSMTFRRRYLGSLQAAPVLDLLLADEDNPRSLAFQFEAVAAATEDLPRQSGDHPDEAPERRLVRDALTRLRAADIARLSQPDWSGHRIDLDDFLARFETDLPKVSDVLTRTYLAHLQAARQYASWINSGGGPI